MFFLFNIRDKSGNLKICQGKYGGNACYFRWFKKDGLVSRKRNFVREISGNLKISSLLQFVSILFPVLYTLYVHSPGVAFLHVPFVCSLSRRGLFTCALCISTLQAWPFYTYPLYVHSLGVAFLHVPLVCPLSRRGLFTRTPCMSTLQAWPFYMYPLYVHSPGVAFLHVPFVFPLSRRGLFTRTPCMSTL